MIALLLALQAAAPQAANVPQNDPPSATVVVTGRRPDRAKAVRHMTATIAPLGDASQPLPRFAAPICPAVDGLPNTLSIRFAERMRQEAKGAGLKVDGAGCSPNITVLFVPNGQEVVRALRKQRPTVFGSLEPVQIGRLTGDAGPIHVWSFTEVRSRDDDRMRVGTTTSHDAPELQVRTASILQSPTRLVVDGSIMLIDQQSSVGKTINQLADYATMRILAQTRPVGNAAAQPTILTLFDTRVASQAAALTPYDLAYLKALYRGQPTDLPLTKIGTMARAINKSLSSSLAPADKPASQ